jgi:hypothetical protein
VLGQHSLHFLERNAVFSAVHLDFAAQLSVAHLFRCNFLFGFCPLLTFGGKECLQTPETFIFNVVSRWTVAPSVIQGCAVGIVIVLWRFIARGRVAGRFLERHRQRKTHVKVCTSLLVFCEGEVWRQLRNRENAMFPNFWLSLRSTLRAVDAPRDGWLGNDEFCPCANLCMTRGLFRTARVQIEDVIFFNEIDDDALHHPLAMSSR